MELVEKDKGSFEVIEKLIRNGLIKKIQYQGQNYYLRKQKPPAPFY
jgi:hypothetical protein